jgi:ferredoxin
MARGAMLTDLLRLCYSTSSYIECIFDFRKEVTMAHRIDPDVCIACGACEPECPESAISEKDGTYVVDEPKCSDDGACVAVCPVDAISQVA